MSKKIFILIVAGVVIGLLWMTVNKKAQRPAEAVVSPEKQARQLYARAQAFEREGEMLKAKKLYQKIISDYPEYDDIEAIQKHLESLNMKIIFSNIQTPDTVIHEVVSGDTLGKLAKKYGTTVDLIKISNNLKSDIIRVGQRLRIWTGKFNLLVDKSQNILMLRKGKEVIKVYDVSTGKNNSTPTGEFRITVKLVDPVWFNRGVIVPPESPDNVLGSRWLGFNIPGYGIHGTVEPETIGQQVTAGCVRMRNEDVEELYSIIPLGTKVTIVD